MGKGCVRAKGSSFVAFFVWSSLSAVQTNGGEGEKGKVKRCCPNFVPFEEKSAALVCNACNASNRKELTNYFILFFLPRYLLVGGKESVQSSQCNEMSL